MVRAGLREAEPLKEERTRGAVTLKVVSIIPVRSVLLKVSNVIRPSAKEAKGLLKGSEIGGNTKKKKQQPRLRKLTWPPAVRQIT